MTSLSVNRSTAAKKASFSDPALSRRVVSLQRKFSSFFEGVTRIAAATGSGPKLSPAISSNLLKLSGRLRYSRIRPAISPTMRNWGAAAGSADIIFLWGSFSRRRL
jgi:hypothetical protein